MRPRLRLDVAVGLGLPTPLDRGTPHVRATTTRSPTTSNGSPETPPRISAGPEAFARGLRAVPALTTPRARAARTHRQHRRRAGKGGQMTLHANYIGGE